MMVYKKYILFSLVFLLLVLPMVTAAKDLGIEDNEKYFINESGLYKIGNKLKIKDKGDVWIDKKIGTTYHVDSKIKKNVDNITLHFKYDIQPDYIRHINHKKKYVRTYFPTQWNWIPNCDKSGENCEGGTVEVMVSGIDKGKGSNTFPIGITGPTWARDGQFAGEFDGESSFVSGNTISAINKSLNYTISFWVNLNELTQDQNIFANSFDTNDRMTIQFSSSSNDLIVGHYNGTDYNGRVETINQLITNTWNFITYNFYNGGANLTVNSVYQQTTTSTPGTNSDAFFTIGTRTDRDEGFTNGSIDETLIYNRSLSQTEITALFNNYTLTSNGPKRTGTPSTDGLVLDINFDDFSVADVSGNGNNGVNTNVSFGVVEDINITLTSGVDYLISGSTFTILNPIYQWRGITLNWDYVGGQYDEFGFHVSILKLTAGFVALALLTFAILYLFKILRESGVIN